MKNNVIKYREQNKQKKLKKYANLSLIIKSEITCYLSEMQKKKKVHFCT